MPPKKSDSTPPGRMSARQKSLAEASSSAAAAGNAKVKKSAVPAMTGKPSKRQPQPSRTGQKRRKVVVEEEDEEEEEDELEDEYDDDEEESEEDEEDDFQDDAFIRKGNSKRGGAVKESSERKKSPRTLATQDKAKVTKNKDGATPATPAAKKAKTGSSSSSSALTRSSNPLLSSTHTDKQFVVSTLKIPRPPHPVADAIQPETFEFLRDLKENNDREYMELNKARFVEAKEDFLDFVRMVKEGLREADREVMDQEAKDSMMRIHRDIRFSNDKTPYKRSFSCHFSRGGKKSIAAGYHLSISPGNETYIGCGVWDPNSPTMHRIRTGIINHSSRFLATLSSPALQSLKPGLEGIQMLQTTSSARNLKNGPVGFPKDHEMIEFLKRRNWAVGHHFRDEEVLGEGFLEKVLGFFDACVPFVQILNEWIG